MPVRPPFGNAVAVPHLQAASLYGMRWYGTRGGHGEVTATVTVTVLAHVGTPEHSCHAGTVTRNL